MKDYLIAIIIGVITFAVGKILSNIFTGSSDIIMFYLGGMSIISLNFFTNIEWFK